MADVEAAPAAEPAMKQEPATRAPNVEKTANPLSRLLFSYISGLMVTGFRRPLNDMDLWELDTPDSTAECLKRFDHYWTIETKKEKPSVPGAIVKAFGPYIALSWIFHAITVASLLGQTQLLDNMLIFLQVPFWRDARNGADGYLMAMGLALLALLRSLTLYQSQMMQQRTGTRIRTALMSAVYRKAMQISTAGRNTTSNGQVVNLASNDTQRMMEIFMFFNEGVFALPQIIVALALLWQQLGAHALTGFACCLVTIPITGISMKGMQKGREDMMKQTDHRAKVTSEVLTAIKVIKFYVWERSFMKSIGATRDLEVKELLRMSLWRSLMNLIIAVMPVIMSLISFLTFTAAGNILLPNVVFTSLALFNILRFPLLMLPGLLGMLAQLKVSFDRFGVFLLAEDRVEEIPPPVDPSSGPVPVVHLKDAKFDWGKEGPVAIKKVSMDAFPGEIVMVVGGVGSGKSALVQGLMGELKRTDGVRHLRGSVAYVPQQAWIMNATLRENILFGQEYDEKKYQKVIDACALRSDIAILPGGDMTEIGERGINISGGQRQRISIARAVYSNSDAVVMDDPLSAVDAHVAQHLFFKCFRSLLADKCIVLVTNQLQFLSFASRIVMLENGEAIETGTYDELIAAKGRFADLIAAHSSGAAEKEEHSHSQVKAHDTEHESKQGGQLVADEEREQGLVALKYWLKYFAAGGVVMFIVTILSFCLENATIALSSWWLAEWSTFTMQNFAAAIANQNALLGIYAGISIGTVVFTGVRSIIFAYFCVNASRTIHNDVLAAVLRYPQSFFDTQPLGRVLNRFTKDLDMIDVLLPMTFQFFLIVLFIVLAVLVIVAIYQPVMVAAIVPLMIIFYFITMFYRYSSIELQRLESISRSPVYAQLSETLAGVTTIRAFGQVDRLKKIYNQRCDANQRAFLTLQIAMQWLGLRLDVLGQILLFLVATFIVIFRNTFSAAISGFVLSNMLNVMQILNRIALQLADCETKMNSVERLDEFRNMEQETTAGEKAPASWPEHGAVEFEHVDMRYRPGLPLVVKDLSVKFKPGERIGVVGRTGAGKSSVMLLLFRIVEAAAGRVLIDGRDISQLTLDEVRRSLAIIPQEPFLFSGTVRENLDPFLPATPENDERLWKVLELVKLKDVVAQKEGQLDAVVAEGGENFSVGQRQLICLGRALLRGSRILLMDEATASVDVETDRHIQTTVRREFKDCTVITIAHRLNTIMDYDKIMVMASGQLVEFGPPTELIDNHGPFASLVESTGRQNAEYLRAIAFKGEYIPPPPEMEDAFIPQSPDVERTISLPDVTVPVTLAQVAAVVEEEKANPEGSD